MEITEYNLNNGIISGETDFAPFEIKQSDFNEWLAPQLTFTKDGEENGEHIQEELVLSVEDYWDLYTYSEIKADLQKYLTK